MAGNSEQLYVGIDCGAVSINCAVINEKRQLVYESPYERHLGKVEENVWRLIKNLYKMMGEDNIQSVSFTGNHGKKLSEQLSVSYEFETIGQVLGSLFVRPGVRTIISMGGQDTALLQISNPPMTGGVSEGTWDLHYFNTNGPCASGTGSFIDQQAQRLATSIYSEKVEISQDRIDSILKDFINLGLTSKEPSNVACRCTVFTKSDMIHLQNKGERLEDIISGLHVGNARNYMSTIVSNRVLEDPVIFIGGLSLNALQVMAFRKYFPGLEVPPHSASIGAIGVALQALESGRKDKPVADVIDKFSTEDRGSIEVGERLILKKTEFPKNNDILLKPASKKGKLFLGVDIGSTTTKYAVINEDREIIHKKYVHTRGKPIEVTQELLKNIRDGLGGEIEIAGSASTGSGRNVVGDFLNVDLIIDEITAHARGAVEIDPEVDTIFEIGGQDSKYIYISNTFPLDFDMNKVCAAGTGSFLHELSNKYGVNIVEEFQQIALSSENPVKLAERCTVFMESDLVFYHQMGLDQTDLLAGLCYAIVHNYLNRVVEKRKIGEKVMFLGGPSLNKGVVAAFENVLGRGLIVPKHREVLGAYGAALSVMERMVRKGIKVSTFRGIDSAVKDKMDYTEKTCHADENCHNQCKLKIYDFDGRRSVWGGECGRYDVVRMEGKRKENYFELRQNIWSKYLKGVCGEIKEDPVLEIDGRPTIGMQRALYTYQTGILWAHFFDHLGYRMVLTPPTNPKISQAGIEAIVAETCYPVKVSHGHMKTLNGKTSYIFAPSLVNMQTPIETETGFYCPFVQSNSYMVRMAVPMKQKSLLSPVLHLKYDPDTIAMEIYDQIGNRLGVTRKKVKRAIRYALDIQERFIKELFQKGREILENIGQDDPLVIVTGRPYNLYDERLNLRLGKNLAKIGVSALPMDFVDISSVDLSDFPSMYWGLGAQILRTARLIAGNQNFFGLHLTNFGCGADSFVEHFYKYIMGDKPFLILELDEHSAVAGAMTRLEAYKNVILNSMEKGRERSEARLEMTG